MSTMVLHPRAAPPGRIRVWLGIFDATAAPAELFWALDGAPVAAQPIRPLAAAHAHGSRSFAGVFELQAAIAAGAPRRLTVRAGNNTAGELAVQSVPAAIPADGWLRLLIASCYHRAEDRGGQAVRTFRNIAAAQGPDLTLLMGDQVYLDLPTLENFPDDEAKLAVKFETNYRLNWDQNGGLAGILDGAPSVCCPDDHEYWNNFPHSSPIVQNSLREASRGRWKRAADQAFDAFQVAAPAQRGDNVVVDIDPLSINILDQRTQRQDDRSATLTPAGMAQLEAWVDRLIAERKFGAVVTGQSLLDKAVGELQGRVADRALANYGDYPRIVRALARLADAGRPVLLLTGDVHWGRVSAIQQDGRARFYEIVSSPSSLVSTVGADQVKTIGAGIRSLFGGQRERWPRHAAAPDPQPFFAPQVFGKTYKTAALHKQKGNQFVILALRRAAGGLDAKVTYYEIHASPQRPAEVDLPPLRDGV